MNQRIMNIAMAFVILTGAVVSVIESGRTDRLQARVAQLETIAAYHVETMNSLAKNQATMNETDEHLNNSIDIIKDTLNGGVRMPKPWDGGTITLDHWPTVSIPASSDTAPQESRSTFSDSGTVESSTSHTPVR